MADLTNIDIAGIACLEELRKNLVSNGMEVIYHMNK